MLRCLKGRLPGERVCELGLGHAAFREVKWGSLNMYCVLVRDQAGRTWPSLHMLPWADNQRDVTQLMADAVLIRLKMESGLV